MSVLLFIEGWLQQRTAESILEGVFQHGLGKVYEGWGDLLCCGENLWGHKKNKLTMTAYLNQCSCALF